MPACKYLTAKTKILERNKPDSTQAVLVIPGFTGVSVIVVSVACSPMYIYIYKYITYNRFLVVCSYICLCCKAHTTYRLLQSQVPVV